MYGFGSRINGVARHSNTQYTNRFGAYRYWRLRFLGMPFTVDAEFLTLSIVYDIELRDAAGTDLLSEAVRGPTTSCTYSSTPVYPTMYNGSQDWAYSFEFERAVQIREGYIDLRYVRNDWVYEYSWDGISWTTLARESAQDVVDAGDENTRVQITTEFWS